VTIVKIVKMLITGLVLIILVMLAEVVVTLPFGVPAGEDAGTLQSRLFWEFLLTALPAGALTFLAALILALKTKKDTLIHAVVWTALYLLYMLAVAIGNQNTGPIFGNIAFYILIVLYFCGPLLYARWKKLPD